jgi:hypothetical protein
MLTPLIGLVRILVTIPRRDSSILTICSVFSMYYKRRERHWRVAFMFGGAALSGAFGGVLAFGISKMHGIGGQPGWAWVSPLFSRARSATNDDVTDLLLGGYIYRLRWNFGLFPDSLLPCRCQGMLLDTEI